MPELLSITTLIICFIFIIFLLKFFSIHGLYVYTVVAILASNIQVLKLTQYSFYDHPVALGTVVFSTIFAVDNILTEYFGADIARKNVWISFVSYLFFSIIMKLDILHPEIINSNCLNLHNEMNRLFNPSFVLFFSSIISYAISQLLDILIFTKLKIFFKNSLLEIRAFITMACSAFIDNCIFSILAWYIFSENPVSLSSLWSTYIIVTYSLRIVIALLCVPIIRFAGIVLKK